MEYVAALILAAVLVLANGCTVDLGPWVKRHETGQEKDEMKVHFSEVVIVGQVAGIHDSDLPGVKNIDVDVMCSYKGNIQTKRIHVYGMGNRMEQIKGCPKAILKQDEQAVLFLKRLPARNGKPWFEIEFAPIRGDIGVTVDDLTMVCGLNQTFGGEVLANGDCYTPIEEEDCEKYVLPTAPPSTEKPVKVTEIVVVTPKDDEVKEDPEATGSNGDKQNDDNNTYDTKTGKTTGTAESKDNPENGAAHVTLSCLIVVLPALVLSLL